MTTRPTTAPLWATDANYSTGVETGLPTKLDPGAGVRAQGFLANRRVPARWVNYALGIVGDWVQYLIEKTDDLYHVRNFGASPAASAAANVTAIQAAIDARATAGGGVVMLGVGVYVINALLTLKPSVILRGVRGVTVLSMDHATANMFACTAGSLRVEDILFAGAQANTGNVFDDPSADIVLTVVGCGVNVGSSNLHGKVLFCGAGSVVTLKDCDITVLLTGAAAFTCPDLTLSGGRVVMAPAATVPLVSTGLQTIIDRTLFKQVSTLGDVSFIRAAAGVTKVTGAIFDVDDSGAGNGTRAVQIDGGLVLTEGCAFLNDTTPYDVVSAAADGSDLQLLPLALHDIHGLAATLIPYVASQQVVSDNTDQPVVTWPDPMFAGQPFDFTLRNAHASDDWTGPISLSGPVVYDPNEIGNLNHGHNLAVHFVAQRLSVGGQLSWVQQAAAANY